MKPQTILIVDDEPIVRSLCALLLKRNGFNFIFAENGEDGLRIYKEQHQNIALVLADLSMPVMDGIKMVIEMFGIEPYSRVIFMTGFPAEITIPEDLRKLCGTLDKPFTSKHLLAEINNRLTPEATPSSS